MEDLDLLRQLPYFSKLEDRDLRLLAEVGEKEDYPKGSTIIEEGEVNNYIYFIVSGQIKISLEKIAGQEITLALLKDGDVFGETCLYSEDKASPKVVALKDATIVRFSKNDFLHGISNNQVILANILREGGYKQSHDSASLHEIRREGDEESRYQKEFSIFEKRFEMELEEIKLISKRIEDLSNETSAYIKDKSSETISWVEQRSKEAIESNEKRSREVTEHAEKRATQAIEAAERSIADALEESKNRHAGEIKEIEDAIASARAETEAEIKKVDAFWNYIKTVFWTVLTIATLVGGFLGWLGIKYVVDIKKEYDYIKEVKINVEKYHEKFYNLSSLEAMVLNIDNVVRESNFDNIDVFSDIDRLKRANTTYKVNKIKLFNDYIASARYEEYKPEVVVEALNSFLKIVDYADDNIEYDNKIYINNSFLWSLRKIKGKEDFRYRLKNRDNILLFGQILKKRRSDFYSNQLIPLLNSILIGKEFNEEAKFAVAEALARLEVSSKYCIDILISVMKKNERLPWRRCSAAVSLLHLQDPKSREGRDYLFAEMKSPDPENSLIAALSLGEAMARSDTIKLDKDDRQELLSTIEEGIKQSSNRFKKEYAEAIWARLKEKDKQPIGR